MVRLVSRAVTEELTPHQREVFTAIVIDGVPLDALALKLGSNRNALYKTMFEARRKLRTRLAADGYMSTSTRRDDSSCGRKGGR
jgi:RNA polymerase sigma-70 factor (ECF subfamily)